MAASENTNHKLSIDVETVSGEQKQLPFTSLTLVPIGIIRATRHDQNEQMWAIYEWAIDAKGMEILDQLPASQMLPLLTRMQEASQIALGESSASSPSSTSTARRSKRTASTKA